MVQQSYSGVVLMDTDIVLSDFDEDGRCAVVIVAKGRFVVQEGFVVVAETVLHGALVVGYVSECVVESS